jgi:hypothetical protein
VQSREEDIGGPRQRGKRGDSVSRTRWTEAAAHTSRLSSPGASSPRNFRKHLRMVGSRRVKAQSKTWVWGGQLCAWPPGALLCCWQLLKRSMSLDLLQPAGSAPLPHLGLLPCCLLLPDLVLPKLHLPSSLASVFCVSQAPSMGLLHSASCPIPVSPRLTSWAPSVLGSCANSAVGPCLPYVTSGPTHITFSSPQPP